MDVTGFQNLMIVQAPGLSAVQTVSGRQLGQKTDDFASKLKNATAVREVASQTNANGNTIENVIEEEKQIIVPEKQSTVEETGGLKKQMLENETAVDIQTNALNEVFYGNTDNQQPEELTGQEIASESVAFMPQVLAQDQMLKPNTVIFGSVLPEASEPRPNLSTPAQTEEIKVALPLKDGQIPEGNPQRNFDVTALTEKQSLDQNTDNSVVQTGLLKNAAEWMQQVQPIQTTQPVQAVQPVQVTLESQFAETGQISPRTLVINADTQVVNPDQELADVQVVNLTEKESSAFARQQDQTPEKQSQKEEILTPNTDSGQVKTADQTVTNSTNTFTVPVDTPMTNSRPDLAANLGQAQAEPKFTPPEDQYQIKNQIIDQARLINRENQQSEMVIRLKPEHLGDLVLKVTVNNGVVNADFHSNNSEVRSLLEASLHQLKQDLTNAGFKVDSVNISAGLSQFTAEQDRQLDWQRQSFKSTGKKGGAGYVESIESQTIIQTGVNFNKNDGVDYLI